MRDALKAKGLIGANETTIQALDKLDLTNAQKRDERFYPSEAVVVFNQKVREARVGHEWKIGRHHPAGRSRGGGRKICHCVE